MYRADAFYARNVLIEFRVNCHVLGSDSKSLSVLVLILDVEYEGKTSRIFGKHLFDELDCKMYAFDYKGLLSRVEIVDYFRQLFLYKGALLFVAFESQPILRCILAFLF